MIEEVTKNQSDKVYQSQIDCFVTLHFVTLIL